MASLSNRSLFQVCLKHEDDSIDKGFCIEELAEMYQCVDNNDCSDGSVSSTERYLPDEKWKLRIADIHAEQHSRLVCVPPGSCGDPSYLAVLQQLPCQVIWWWWTLFR